LYIVYTQINLFDVGNLFVSLYNLICVREILPAHAKCCASGASGLNGGKFKETSPRSAKPIGSEEVASSLPKMKVRLHVILFNKYYMFTLLFCMNVIAFINKMLFYILSVLTRRQFHSRVNTDTPEMGTWEALRIVNFILYMFYLFYLQLCTIFLNIQQDRWEKYLEATCVEARSSRPGTSL
jgi:hypothetical protein